MWAVCSWLSVCMTLSFYYYSLGCTACQNCKDTAYCESCSMVCLSVYWSIEMLFAVCAHKGPRVESNGSPLLGLWLTSPAGWLPRTRISCRTLCSVLKYGLPLPFYCNSVLFMQTCTGVFCKCHIYCICILWCFACQLVLILWYSRRKHCEKNTCGWKEKCRAETGISLRMHKLICWQ